MRNKVKRKTYSRRIQSKLPIARELEELINNVLRYGRYEIADFGEILFEDVEMEDWSDYADYFHREIPNVLKKLFEEIGLRCQLYYKKDDVPGYKYVANCVDEKTGVPIALGLDIDYDPSTYEVVIHSIYGEKNSEYPSSVLVYYREV